MEILLMGLDLDFASNGHSTHSRLQHAVSMINRRKDHIIQISN